MSLYGIKIVTCADWNIPEGDTRPAYSIDWYRRVFRYVDDANRWAALIEQKRADDPTFAGAVVCELIEQVEYARKR